MTEFNEALCCCAKHEEETNQLVNHLLGDIQLLASEVVLLRYAVSWSLPKHEGETVRGEILSDLYGSYYTYPAYQRFISVYYDGEDPMEDKAFIEHLIKLSKGEVSAALRQLTF